MGSIVGAACQVETFNVSADIAVGTAVESNRRVGSCQVEAHESSNVEVNRERGREGVELSGHTDGSTPSARLQRLPRSLAEGELVV